METVTCMLLNLCYQSEFLTAATFVLSSPKYTECSILRSLGKSATGRQLVSHWQGVKQVSDRQHNLLIAVCHRLSEH